eukprot:3419051-Rhodomonas_salina.3
MCSCAVFRARVPSHQEALPAARSATPRLSPASSPSDTRYLPDDFSIAVKTATRRSLLPFDFAVVRHVTCSNTLADNVHLGPQMPLLGGSVAQFRHAPCPVLTPRGVEQRDVVALVLLHAAILADDVSLPPISLDFDTDSGVCIDLASAAVLVVCVREVSAAHALCRKLRMVCMRVTQLLARARHDLGYHKSLAKQMVNEVRRRPLPHHLLQSDGRVAVSLSFESSAACF